MIVVRAEHRAIPMTLKTAYCRSRFEGCPGPEQRRFNDMLMETTILKIEDIYVPVKRRKTLNPEVVNEIAESMLEEGQLSPIWVRKGDNRLVLVEGLHRLEACKALGEETIVGLLVQARRK